MENYDFQNNMFKAWFLLVAIGYYIASITWAIIGNVDEKFFSRFCMGTFCLAIYAILRKLK